MKHRKLLTQGFPAALIILSAAISIWGQDQSPAKHNTRPNQTSSSGASVNNPSTDPVKYSYEFTQPKFYVKHIVIKHDANGRGTVTFERLNEDVPVEEPLQLSPAALAKLTGAWESLKFLDSQEDYQSSKQFPHLGTMKIGMERGGRKRVAEFNWTNNSDAETIVTEYRKAADQAIWIFDVGIGRQNQPLNLPKLMEGLESLLNRNGISDPKQLLPLLKDMSGDERVPLIARNHALRLIKKIEK